jgi:DNA (cytosine-5)-methyltransferase 1
MARMAAELEAHVDETMTGYAEITLDACAGEGGGARGLVQAGHYVVGVDINPRCRDGYLRSGAHEFICADVMDLLADASFMRRFTFVSAHPPCQSRSRMTNCRPGLAALYPRLIRPMQPLLDTWGGPFIIENVEGARDELRDPVTLCMHMFGRETYRHRLIEAGGGLTLAVPAPPPAPLKVRGRKPGKYCGWPHPVPTARAGHWKPDDLVLIDGVLRQRFVSVAGHERKEPVCRVMEIDLYDHRTGTGWMSNRDAIAEAIPPYLGYWIAGQVAAWRKAQEMAA